MTTTLDRETADRFARIALGHVEREYPHKPGHVLAGASEVQGPRETHPVFFGSFDYPSARLLMLVRLLNRFPGMPSAEAIRAC
jgi:hypothetical protein